MSEIQGPFLKFLLPGRIPPYRVADQAPWPPVGEWTGERLAPVLCRHGWHVWRARALGEALYSLWENADRSHGDTVEAWVAEGRGAHSQDPLINGGPKIAFAEARLVRGPVATLRLDRCGRLSGQITDCVLLTTEARRIRDLLATWGIKLTGYPGEA